MRVTDAPVDRLEETFADVRYVLGFCRADGECRDPTATREESDRVRFGDRAEVVSDHPGPRTVDVYGDAHADPDGWDGADTVRFGARHAEHGVPTA